MKNYSYYELRDCPKYVMAIGKTVCELYFRPNSLVESSLKSGLLYKFNLPKVASKLDIKGNEHRGKGLLWLEVSLAESSAAFAHMSKIDTETHNVSGQLSRTNKRQQNSESVNQANARMHSLSIHAKNKVDKMVLTRKRPAKTELSVL